MSVVEPTFHGESHSLLGLNHPLYFTNTEKGLYKTLSEVQGNIFQTLLQKAIVPLRYYECFLKIHFSSQKSIPKILRKA